MSSDALVTLADGLLTCLHLTDDSRKGWLTGERRVLVHSSEARVYKMGKGWLETGERERKRERERETVRSV